MQTLLVDFDGVIHSFTSGWTGPCSIKDPPNEGAIKFLVEATEHFEVYIFSTRCIKAVGKWAVYKWLRCELVRYFKDNPKRVGEVLPKIKFTSQKIPGLIISNRCLKFEGTFPSMEKLNVNT